MSKSNRVSRKFLNSFAPLLVFLLLCWSFGSFNWMLWQIRSGRSSFIPVSVTISIPQFSAIFSFFLVVFLLFLLSFWAIVTTSPGIALSAPLCEVEEIEQGFINENEEDHSRELIGDDEENGIPLNNLESDPLRIKKKRNHTDQYQGLCNAELGQNQHLESQRVIEVKPDGSERFCLKCQLVKPSRSHHCSICETCVLKMDHHCPWISNCVGHANQKLFLLFLFYGFLYCLFIVSVVFPITISFSYNMDPKLDQSLYFISLVLLFVGAVFGLCFLLFFCIHSYYLFTNQTTIQQLGDCSTIKIVSMNDRGRLERAIMTKLNIYDIGFQNNFIQVFGNNAWFWMIPIPSSLSNGHRFPINHKTLSFIESQAV